MKGPLPNSAKWLVVCRLHLVRADNIVIQALNQVYVPNRFLGQTMVGSVHTNQFTSCQSQKINFEVLASTYQTLLATPTAISRSFWPGRCGRCLFGSGGRHLGHALLKKLIFGFWHLPIKLEPLMTLFYWFGVLKASKIRFEVCTLNISPLDQIRKFRETGRSGHCWQGLPEFLNLIWGRDI